jgi:hypothetical protein
LWQLKKLSTNEPLSEPGNLPENWGPIFGLHGIQDRLGDLVWLGESYSDMGWIQVGEAVDVTAVDGEGAWEEAKKLLRESDWSMLPDVPMTKEEKASWIEYRRGLRNIRAQKDFPNSMFWPTKPE